MNLHEKERKTVLVLKNVNKEFHDIKAVSDLNLHLKKGEIYGLLGANGAGKTTAIRILLGILPSDTGKVLVDNKKLSFDENAFGYLPEERGLYLKYTVKSQLMHFASLYGMKKKEALNSIEYWLEKFEISEYLNKKVETLSKGNKQKIQLIVAVMHDPEVIILDEPFSGLDPVNVELFKTVIRELLAKGKTLIFSSHRMADVEEFCDDIIMLKKGETILQGNLDKIKEDYGIKGLVVEGEEKVQDFLKELGFEALEFKKGSYRVNLKDLEKGKELLRKITNTDLDIRGFYFERPSLNDIFIERLGD